MENVQYHTTIHTRCKQHIAFKILFNRFSQWLSQCTLQQKAFRTPMACSAERVLASTRQNPLHPQHKFWRALTSTRSAKHASNMLGRKRFVTWYKGYL